MVAIYKRMIDMTYTTVKLHANFYNDSFLLNLVMTYHRQSTYSTDRYTEGYAF